MMSDPVQDRRNQEAAATSNYATAQQDAAPGGSVARSEGEAESMRNQLRVQAAHAKSERDMGTFERLSEVSSEQYLQQADRIAVKPDQPAVADAPPAPEQTPEPKPAPAVARSNPLGISGGDHVVHGDGHYFNPTAGGSKGQSIDQQPPAPTRGGRR
jgi:hypothetical protein